ncbi:hypothetical protein F4823DRAFT_52167 [Ustulina deusta]|nr:hypothetical protein F4823DRAFT_52167 [Ustulina deusta]
MTTSLEVAWTETTTITDDDGQVITSSSISRVVQDTTLIIPPLTTTAIEFWNDVHTNDGNQTLIWLTWSIAAPPFVITNDPNPKRQTGVTHPAVTRTIPPPPPGAMAVFVFNANNDANFDYHLRHINTLLINSSHNPNGQVRPAMQI